MYRIPETPTVTSALTWTLFVAIGCSLWSFIMVDKYHFKAVLARMRAMRPDPNLRTVILKLTRSYFRIPRPLKMAIHHPEVVKPIHFCQLSGYINTNPG